MSASMVKTVAVGALAPAALVAGIVAYGLWTFGHLSPPPAPVRPMPQGVDIFDAAHTARAISDAKWKGLMRCIDRPLCDALMDKRKADAEHKKTLDRLKMRPLDPTGNRIAPRPRWDWKQT